MTQSRQMDDRLKTWTGGNQIQVKEMPTETMTLYNYHSRLWENKGPFLMNHKSLILYYRSPSRKMWWLIH